MTTKNAKACEQGSCDMDGESGLAEMGVALAGA